MILRPMGSTLFPYTTLFRSGARAERRGNGACRGRPDGARDVERDGDRKSTRLNSSHPSISYAVFCLKKKTMTMKPTDCTIAWPSYVLTSSNATRLQTFANNC